MNARIDVFKVLRFKAKPGFGNDVFDANYFDEIIHQREHPPVLVSLRKSRIAGTCAKDDNVGLPHGNLSNLVVGCHIHDVKSSNRDSKSECSRA
jgi:hypothetical protein